MSNQDGISQHVVAVEFQGEWQGLGVVVPTGVVLTAAHCLPAPDTVCFLADDVYVRVRTSTGRIGTMNAVLIDAVSDIAALEPIDDDPFVLDGMPPLSISLEWSRTLVVEDRPPMPGKFLPTM